MKRAIVRNLTGLNHEELQSFVEEFGEKAYRSRQLFKWIYAKYVRHVDEMSDISLRFREQMGRVAQLGHINLAEKKVSRFHNQPRESRLDYHYSRQFQKLQAGFLRPMNPSFVTEMNMG